jgi:protein-tyrosine phosphatase
MPPHPNLLFREAALLSYLPDMLDDRVRQNKVSCIVTVGQVATVRDHERPLAPTASHDVETTHHRGHFEESALDDHLVRRAMTAACPRNDHGPQSVLPNVGGDDVSFPATIADRERQRDASDPAAEHGRYPARQTGAFASACGIAHDLVNSRRDPGGRLIAAERTGDGDATFRVLMVCTANQCRSPMAEHLMREAGSALGLDWVVESAGVLARDGRPMHQSAAQLLADRSIDVAGWATRRLTRAMIENADLVLTAAAEHRRAVVMLDPSAAGRTLILLQCARFAALAGRIPIDDPAKVGVMLLDRIAHARGELQPVSPDEDDIPDPIGKPLRAFHACFDQVEAAIQSILLPVRAT